MKKLLITLALLVGLPCCASTFVAYYPNTLRNVKITITISDGLWLLNVSGTENGQPVCYPSFLPAGFRLPARLIGEPSRATNVWVKKKGE